MRLKKVKREEFIKLYRELSLKEFLKKMEITSTTLYSILDKEGIPRNREYTSGVRIELT